MKTQTEIEIYETNGEKSKPCNYPTLTIESHWNNRDRVNLVFDKKIITVVAEELKKAIDNAINVRR